MDSLWSLDLSGIKNLADGHDSNNYEWVLIDKTKGKKPGRKELTNFRAPCTSFNNCAWRLLLSIWRVKSGN
jgi:hypothetical protein